jgi:hypothetical protein
METAILLDILGLFVCIAGFVLGLGAVTVIDLHGFLGRKSAYWTEATTRTHKVTKPLIWAGITLALVGGSILYRAETQSVIPLIQLGISVLLIVNGIFLSFWVSPFLLAREKEGRAQELLPNAWQQRIVISFIISFLGWWSALLLLVIYVVGS